MINCLHKGVDECVNRIILIKDSGSFSGGEKFVALATPCFEEISFIFNETIEFGLKEKSNDVAELLINQILCSAVEDVDIKSIFIVKSNNFSVADRTIPLKTIRYFIAKRKQFGDVFFFVGKGRKSKLIAKFLGFRKVKLKKQSGCYKKQGR